jgi:AraC family transcriptional regulator, transcriptional activator of pobA
MNTFRRTPTSDFDTELKLKGFKAYEIDSKTGKGHLYSRKDFYKISMNTGKYLFHYADRSFETDDTILFFGNPQYLVINIDAINRCVTAVGRLDPLPAGL